MIETVQHKYLKQKSTAPKSEKQKVFFPNLDGLRFICFLMVFLFHSYKTIFADLRTGSNAANRSSYWISEFLFQNGELGVNFFFVLSGFLITYLLIKEKEFTGRIHLGNFYVRRVLRIWPMFYLCVFIGFLLVPFLKELSGQPSTEIARPLYYIFLVNNFDYIHSWPSFPDALILIVLWSVAVEEQFYLTWPVLLKHIPKKFYPVLFAAIVLFTLVFRSFYTGGSDHDYAVMHFHTFAVIGDMALGALMAYYCSYDSPFLRFITNMRRGQILMIYLVAILLILFRKNLFEFPATIVFERLVIGVFFGLIILEQNFSRRSLFKFSSFRNISKLGIYTYGLYCLHFFIISLVQSSLWKLGISVNSISAWGITLLSLVVVTGVCILSYNYFEKPFLRMKNRFAFITKTE